MQLPWSYHGKAPNDVRLADISTAERKGQSRLAVLVEKGNLEFGMSIFDVKD